MPELPEVEAWRRTAERAAAGRTIVEVRCAEDPIVFEGVATRRLRRALRGRRVAGVDRRGKHLWFVLDRRPWPTVHFGMAGGLHVPGEGGVRLMSSGRGPASDGWPPPYTKLELRLDDGRALAITDRRRLARIRLRHDPAGEPPVSLLGFDALREVPSPARFAELLRARAAPVKAVLLDQSFAAGVGNWVADEILYQARIDPRRPARSLSDSEVRRVRAALRSVIATAVQVGADSDRYPRTWLFHVKWDRQAGTLTRRGERIRRDTIGGRTTAWVPAVQR